ncbi:MAG: sulfite exporter TauE/SafE family protein [Nitrospiraceae bacterium]|nr:MAG: sulfite exporter TauE/SafE family protein [Nitrospiraceae bacterium]
MFLSDFFIVLIIGAVGGFFNTFVGAGSLFTIPVLIVLGLPPHVAIATNRLGVTGSDIAGWYGFHIKGVIDYRAGIALAVPSLAGAVIGANLVVHIDEKILRAIIAIISLIILLLIVMKPDAGISRTKARSGFRPYVMGVALSFIVGIYGGFYGAGAGTFLFYILVLIFGQTFIESAGTHELANLSFSAMAAAIFAYKGLIDYGWTIPLFIGSFAGSYLSAYHAEKIGNVWLKRIFVIVVIAVVIKLFV